jgi:tripartite-type tricarboxylate transporter receptor subunit TctC
MTEARMAQTHCSNRLIRRALLAALATLVCFASAPAMAQGGAAWPAKPIRMVVGFAAGGPTDVVARAFAEHAARALGQPVVVENKPGANSILAAEAVANAPADGHTLLLAATNHTMIPALYSARVKFDAVRAFAPVCTLAVSPTVLVVGPAMPVTSLGAFMQQVRQEPGKRSYGTPGAGSSGHFASEQFLRMNGLSMNHIPYKGAAPVVTDLIGGQLGSSFATLGSVLPQIQGGKLTALAVAAPRRSPLLPGVPTFAEAGVNGYAADAWYGLLAPAGTPATVLQALEKVAVQFTEQPANAARLHALGLEPQSTCRDAFAAQMAREVKNYTQLAHELQLKIE